MPQPINPARLSLVRAWMDKALEAPNGLEIDIPTKAEAQSLRNQFYTARDRAAKALNGQSDYDTLVFLIREQPNGTIVVFLGKGNVVATTAYKIKEV